MEQQERFETWAIVELFGHQKIAGQVREQVLGGATMLRVDVPAGGAAQAFTRFFGAGAIYAITPVTEEVARRAAAALRMPAVTVWMPALERALPAGGPDPDEQRDDAYLDGMDPEDDDDELE